MITFMTTIGIIVYCAGFTFTGVIANKYFSKLSNETEIVMCLFWPVGLPVTLGLMIGENLGYFFNWFFYN